MKISTVILKVSASAILILISFGQVFSQSRVAGIVQEIQGATYWKKDNRANEVRLDPRHDLARILHVGEQVRSDRDGYLRLLLCGGEKTLRGRSAWFPISATQECPNRKALEEYGRLGGRDRGSPSQVFSPADHSATTPRLFVMRWIPAMAKCTVSLAIKDIEGKSIWEEEEIDGNLGAWNSSKAKEVLTRYRANGEESPLLLRLTDSCANQIDITFSLLSTQSEATLQAELAQWDKNPSTLMLHLGRASVFESYRIFSEAAEEYEAALKVAPESRDLLIRTILAQRSTGNFNREEQLRKRLPPGTAVP
jgi:hypothetical protein